MKRILTLAFMSLLLAFASFAQETSAGIQGTVKDPSGAAVPGASVEATSSALIAPRTATTDGEGKFQLTALPVGTYTVSVTAKGFRKENVPNVVLETGHLVNVEAKLVLGAVTETIEVTDAVSNVDVTSSKVAAVVDRQILDGIPTGRSYQSVIPFAPGARQEPLQSTTGARTNGFQIDGATDSENTYLVDGVNTTNILSGGVGRSFQMEFVQEVQIKSSSFEAEYGGALGGVINAVAKRGSNNWHGSLFGYYQSASMDANDPCASGYTSTGFSTVCGLRLDPTLAGLNTTTRLDGTPQYYVPKKDHHTTLEPGYSVGGALIKNRLWIFSSYIPNIDTTRRTTTFTGANPGPRTLSLANLQHNAFNRLDYRLRNSINLFASWNYGYFRTTGLLSGADSTIGQLNASSGTDPNTLRSDTGSVQPNALWSFGGDWTPTSKATITVRYGRFFNNVEQRGTPVGTRYVYQASVNANSKDLAGNPFPSSSFNSAGFGNIPSNLATVYDAYKRNSFTVDGSYFVGRLFGGTHIFKTGFFMQQQSNTVLTNFQGGRIDLYWGQAYAPVTSGTACNAVMAGNVTNFGSAANVCQGQFGYFVVGTGVTNTGGTQQTAKAIYLQDAWQVGHGLTLNLGIRFDQEVQPPYDANRFPTVSFGWGQKVAPRLGAAYDLLHNGKVKVYASYGVFYDIMKMGLARGSFGSDYWHNCVYALDTTNFSSLTPTYGAGGGCPATGPAPGITGRFIENVDFRATKADTRDPAIDPNMKPMRQHEFVAGADWALSSQYYVTARYARKRLDSAIEDMSITDNLGFYIGNPGTPFSDLLHRPVVTPDANGNNYLTTVPFCAECPGNVKPSRRYDGIEFAISRKTVGKWFGTVSYTYSALRGNYAGLTNTDPTDGGGGRHAPDNGRAFDLPSMGYDPNGKVSDGPLSTDRPNTLKAFGYIPVKWLGMTTTIGLVQSVFEGTPLSTCLPVVGTSSACQWAEGRGNFVQFTRSASGDFVKGNVIMGARTPNYVQSDLSIHHEIRTSENTKLAFEVNALNVLNQHAVTAVNEIAVAGSGLISPTRASRFSGDPLVDWNKIMTAYNYMDALNGTGTFAGVQSKLTLASRYGLPQLYQQARNIRLSIRFTF